MQLYKSTMKKLTVLANSFENNYSSAIDFLFFVFDSYTFEEKKNLVKHFSSSIEKPKERDKEDEKIEISLHPHLEERLTNLCLECDRILNPSQSIEFLLFVLKQIPNDILSDLKIQYTIEGQYYNLGTPEIMEKNGLKADPIHVNPDYPKDHEHYIQVKL